MDPHEGLRQSWEQLKALDAAESKSVEHASRATAFLSLGQFLIEGGLVAARVNKQAAPEGGIHKALRVLELLGNHAHNALTESTEAIQQQQLNTTDPEQQEMLARQQAEAEHHLARQNEMKGEMRYLLDLADEVLGVFDGKKTRGTS